MDNLKQALIAAGPKMLGKGLTVETWGNISLRDPQSGKIYFTPSGMDYGMLTAEDVVVFDAAGNQMEGFRKPSILYPKWRIYMTLYSCFGFAAHLRSVSMPVMQVMCWSGRSPFGR